jgi:hypothetical protein
MAKVRLVVRAKAVKVARAEATDAAAVDAVVVVKAGKAAARVASRVPKLEPSTHP